jgi:hypothetical protein
MLRTKFFRQEVSTSSRSLPTNSQTKGLRSKRRISLIFSRQTHSYQPSFAIVATNNLHWDRSKLTLIYRIITTDLLHPPFHYFSANVLTVPIFIRDRSLIMGGGRWVINTNMLGSWKRRRMSNVWWGPWQKGKSPGNEVGGPSNGSRLGWGVLLVKHETFQSLINLFFPKLLASRGTVTNWFLKYKLWYLNLDFQN